MFKTTSAACSSNCRGVKREAKCVCVCVCACVRVCVRACVYMCVCVYIGFCMRTLACNHSLDGVVKVCHLDCVLHFSGRVEGGFIADVGDVSAWGRSLT